MAFINSDKTYALVSSPMGKQLVKTIKEAGAKILLFPQIQTKTRNLDDRESEYLSKMFDFDWLVFSDVLTVDFFLAKLEEETGMDLFELDSLNICALGEAIADRLRFVQLHADVVPLSTETETIYTALENYIGINQLSGKNFLIINRKSAASELKSKLEAVGAIAVEMEIYETSFEIKDENVRLKALLKGGAIDEFVFSSPEDLIALQTFLEVGNIKDFFNETKISAADEVTFQVLRENGLKPRYFSIK